MITIPKHWSYEETGNSRQLTLFGMIGLKTGAKAFMGPRPDSLFEANGNIGAGISDETAKLHDSYGLSQIRLSCHTALMLFFENLLQAQHLVASRENENSIFIRLFNVEVVIQENPGIAIAYFSPDGLLLAA
ncbi:MAG: hypothetical protein NVSMB39_6210 [Candidatus Saccharimonadales bacterium]